MEIDLDPVQSNVRQIKKYIGKEVHLMAVVKANAYGYGMIEVAEASISAGASWLGVATFDEALNIRLKLSKCEFVPILVLGYVSPKHLSLASRHRITVTAISLEWIEEVAKVAQEPFNFHLKLDTGMNRIGCKTVDEVLSVAKIVANNPYMNWSGAFTHFATSDNVKNKFYYDLQLARFHKFLAIIPERSSKTIHCANSGAVLYHPDKPFFDMVRVGIALTGPPDVKLKHKQQIPLQTSLISIHSTIDLVKQLEAGEKVGYGGEYTAKNKEWIGTVPIGFGDGWHQNLRENAVLVDGKRVPIVGRIAMDQLMLALPKDYPVGTRVTLMGRQGSETISYEEIVRITNQSKMEILTSFTSRIPRVYIRGGSVISVKNELLEFIHFGKI